MYPVKIDMNIADTIIRMQSRFPHMRLSNAEEEALFVRRFKNFSYTGNKKPDIIIIVEIINSLPQPKEAKDIFITYHPDDGSENWRLSKGKYAYIFKSSAIAKKQVIFINKTFDRVFAYILPKDDNKYEWQVGDIIYDFLQVLLINYFAQRRSAVFVHGVGIKDVNNEGYLFAGKSGAGKTTLAKIWEKRTRAMVLNDDRIIAKKVKDKFLIYGSPWHGNFSDYLDSKIESARARKLFFIYHSSKNRLKTIPSQQAFKFLYPAIFPTFWDRGFLDNIISLCHGFVNYAPSFHLGFEKNRKIIEFVRKIRTGKA